MNRYTWRTGILELVMLGVGILFFVPIYVLVNLSLRDPSDQSSPLAPTTNITFANYADAWQQAGLGPALVVSGIVTVVSTVLLILFAALAVG